MRLFVAVVPPADVLVQIGQLIEKLRPLAPRSKWISANGAHVTLAFLGERNLEFVSQLCAAVAKTAEQHSPFHVRFNRLGAFGRGRRARVLWLGTEQGRDAFTALYHGLNQHLAELGYTPDKPSFEPHITLSRARDPKGDRDLTSASESTQCGDLGEWTVSELVIYESVLTPKGPLYTAVDSAALSGG
ncbi:MAG: RNA 2',3'-cyclic phosphodiesterase [Polyangiaceae bacterium]|nr:RNA 2',3'-cyclic phosphodiesterase [Polyangiaceae bacterium]